MPGRPPITDINELNAILKGDKRITVTNADAEIGGWTEIVIPDGTTQSRRQKARPVIANEIQAYEARMKAARKERRAKLAREQAPSKVTVTRKSPTELSKRNAPVIVPPPATANRRIHKRVDSEGIVAHIIQHYDGNNWVDVEPIERTAKNVYVGIDYGPVRMPETFELGAKVAGVSPIDGKPILPAKPRTDVRMSSDVAYGPETDQGEGFKLGEALAGKGKRGTVEGFSAPHRRKAAQIADALLETGNDGRHIAPTWEGGKTGKITRDVEPIPDVIPSGAGFQNVTVPVEQSGTAKVGNQGFHLAAGSPKSAKLKWDDR